MPPNGQSNNPNFSRSQQSGLSSGAVPTVPVAAAPKSDPKAGFFSSLLHAKGGEEKPQAPQVPPPAAPGVANAWDKRVPPVAAIEQFMNPSSSIPLPRSSFPVPQKPGTAAPRATPSPVGAAPVVPQPPPKPATPPVPPRPVSAPVPPPKPVVPPPPPPKPAVPPKPPVPPPPLESLLPKSNIPAPASSQPIATMVPKKPVQVPQPPIKPVDAPKPKVVADDSIGLDLGFEEYVDSGSAPILAASSTPPKAPPPREKIDPNASLFSSAQQANKAAAQPVPASIPVQRTTPPVPPAAAPVPPPVPAKPTAPPPPPDPFADLEKEKAALMSERASNVEKKNAADKEVQELMKAKQAVEVEVAPFDERERAALKEIEDLELKEAGLQGEERRNVESARWVKTEERRKIEDQKWAVKKRLAEMEAQIHAKEDTFVFLIKREKEIDARIEEISKERKRREIQARLDVATKEKDAIVARRTALESKLKDLRTEIANTESLERTIEVDRKKLVPAPQASFDEQRTFAERRYTLEKRQHETEMTRWKLEDDLKQFTETFGKEDALFQEAAKKENDIRREFAIVG